MTVGSHEEGVETKGVGEDASDEVGARMPPRTDDHDSLRLAGLNDVRNR